MHDGQRDRGLVRAVSSWGLAASIINTVVGAGIFAVPAALAASVGLYAPLAFIVCAIGIGSVAICWAEGGSRIPTSGGAYGYIERGLGPMAAFVAGTLLWSGNSLGSGAVAAALADATVSMIPRQWMAPAHAAVIVLVVGVIAWINFGGAARGVQLNEATTIFKLIALGVFLAAGLTALHASNFVQTQPVSTAGFGRALILALFAFTGMEAPLSASGEVTQPAKSIPRALAMALLPVIALYVAIQLVSQGVLGASLAHSDTPLADAMAAVHPSLRLFIVAGSIASMFGYLSSDILGTPRMLFAFAREGLMPRALGRVSPRTHAPHIAITCYAALIAALSISGTFAELAVLSTLAVAIVYMLGSVAAWRLRRRNFAEAGPPLNFRYLTAARAIAIASMTMMIALATRAEILGLVSVTAASVLIWFILSRWGRRFRLPNLPG